MFFLVSVLLRSRTIFFFAVVNLAFLLHLSYHSNLGKLAPSYNSSSRFRNVHGKALHN